MVISGKSTLGPLLGSDQLGRWEKLVSACELTLPSMMSLAIIYVSLVAFDAIAFFAPAARGSAHPGGLPCVPAWSS